MAKHQRMTSKSALEKVFECRVYIHLIAELVPKQFMEPISKYITSKETRDYSRNSIGWGHCRYQLVKVWHTAHSGESMAHSDRKFVAISRGARLFPKLLGSGETT